MESARRKDITDVISTQLHVEIIIKGTGDISIHFKILKIMIIESTCLKVKDLDLYIVETACKFIQFSLILFFEFSVLLNTNYLFVLSLYLALSMLLLSHFYKFKLIK